VAFPGAARTTGGLPAAMPRRRQASAASASRTRASAVLVRFSSTAPATERGASVSVTSSTFTPADAMNLVATSLWRTRSELPARSLTGSYHRARRQALFSRPRPP
jgi:hypothetical protein